MRKSLWIALAVTVSLVVICGILGSFDSDNSVPENNDSAQTAIEQAPPTFSMNNTEKDAIKNGNLYTCIKAFDYADSKGGMVSDVPETTSIEQVSKQPYAYIGKRCVLRGKIKKIEQYSPTITDSQKPWSEILMIFKNRNSTYGTSNIVFVYNGDINKISGRDYIDLNGYFVGTCSGTNAFGGGVDAYMFVGNSIRIVQKYRRYYE